MIIRACISFLLLLISLSVSAQVYQWRDANGNVVFGDSPPESVVADEVELQPLTIADSYQTAEDESTAKDDAEAEADEPDKVEYKQFSVESPEKSEAVRANNGNVMVRLQLEPALQEGHGIAIYLDGKQVANSSATVFSLENLDRGQHTLFAVVFDENDEMLKNTEAVTFNVLRASRI